MEKDSRYGYLQVVPITAVQSIFLLVPGLSATAVFNRLRHWKSNRSHGRTVLDINEQLNFAS